MSYWAYGMMERERGKMEHIIRPCTVNVSFNLEKWVSVFIKIALKGDRLSISGVIGPKRNGNAYGSCGQINMSFRDNYKPNDIHYAPGWDKEKLEFLLALWDKYHLNDLQAACEHQRAVGWTWKTHPSRECPICGYKLGHEWKAMDVPQWVVDWLFALPKSNKVPAWV
jgi:hypothetical protein